MKLDLKLFILIFFFGIIKAYSIKITCNFENQCREEKKCITTNLKIHKENVEIQITNPNKHKVKEFSASNNETFYFPRGLDKFFPNLEVLRVCDSKLRKISYKDLHNFTSLKLLDLGGNNIEVLREKLFQSNLHLEVIDLSNNLIRFIYPTVFDGLLNLSSLNLNNNACYKGNAININETKILIQEIKISCWHPYLQEITEKFKKLKLNANKSTECPSTTETCKFYIIALITALLVCLLSTIITVFCIMRNKKSVEESKIQCYVDVDDNKYEEISEVLTQNQQNQESLVDGYACYEEIVYTKNGKLENFYSEMTVEVKENEIEEDNECPIYASAHEIQ